MLDKIVSSAFESAMVLSCSDQDAGDMKLGIASTTCCVVNCSFKNEIVPLKVKFPEV